jgi:hypothetical protein
VTGPRAPQLEALADLRAAHDRRVEAAESEFLAIEAARAAGATWAQIAGPLGLGSAQSAQQHRDRLAGRAAAR